MPELLTVGETARLLRVSPETLREWADAGRGPRALRLSPKVTRYKAADVTAFIEGRPAPEVRA